MLQEAIESKCSTTDKPGSYALGRRSKHLEAEILAGKQTMSTLPRGIRVLFDAKRPLFLHVSFESLSLFPVS